MSTGYDCEFKATAKKELRMLRELAYLIRQDLADILDNLRDCFRRDDERG